MTNIICNPLDLAYQYQDIREITKRSVAREGADPSAVLFKGRYYMFVSMSGGFFHSDDLVNWTHQATAKLPANDYAPDVRVVNGALYITASRRGRMCPIFRSMNPLADDFEEVTPGTMEYWDPNMFQDDDGRLYIYWGCSPRDPIFGVELDPASLQPIGDKVPLASADTDSRGWEHKGENYALPADRSFMEKRMEKIIGTGPYIEGAWMTKRNGLYYLQYAAPATETNTYGDGYFVGTGPLGPFEYSPYSPFSLKPGGFITGAGHGSTFQDTYGNWWHAATMRISVNHNFERRVGLFPAGFDQDGVLLCNQNFADYPLRVPDGPVDPWSLTPTDMLLSYRKPVTASSEVADHPASLAVNEDVRTWWVADGTLGQWLQVDLLEGRTVSAIQINFADHELAALAPKKKRAKSGMVAYRAIYGADRPVGFVVQVSVDATNWTTVSDQRAARAVGLHPLITLDAPVPARYVRVRFGAMPFGASPAVSGLRVFGMSEGGLPQAVVPAAVRVDGRTASIGWKGAAGAHGYNVRYGIAPDKLYHSWLVYDQTSLVLPNLNAGHDYWFAVDSFGEAGVTEGSPVLAVGPKD